MGERELTVVLTKDRHGEPLAVVRNLPGLDAEMTPSQMRFLAEALLVAADECESRPTGDGFSEVTRQYPIAALSVQGSAEVGTTWFGQRKSRGRSPRDVLKAIENGEL